MLFSRCHVLGKPLLVDTVMEILKMILLGQRVYCTSGTKFFRTG